VFAAWFASAGVVRCRHRCPILDALPPKPESRIELDAPLQPPNPCFTRRSTEHPRSGRAAVF
jgi:hypothetical protein